MNAFHTDRTSVRLRVNLFRPYGGVKGCTPVEGTKHLQLDSGLGFCAVRYYIQQIYSKPKAHQGKPRVPTHHVIHRQSSSLQQQRQQQQQRRQQQQQRQKQPRTHEKRSFFFSTLCPMRYDSSSSRCPQCPKQHEATSDYNNQRRGRYLSPAPTLSSPRKVDILNPPPVPPPEDKGPPAKASGGKATATARGSGTVAVPMAAAQEETLGGKEVTFSIRNQGAVACRFLFSR